jgi:glycosyltransferase involved in cell wall biosynthesis
MMKMLAEDESTRRDAANRASAEKTILILCDIFPPAFGPRMGYLCKYIRQMGWKPVVVTEYADGEHFSFLTKDVEALYLRYYAKKGLAGRIEWAVTFLCDALFGCKDRRMYREARKLMAGRRFDLILCSTYRTFPLSAAWRLARRTGLPLVADLRDIIEQYAGNEFIDHSLPEAFGIGRLIASVFRRRSLKTRNRILRDAACVATVSPWHVSVLKTYNANTRLIYNGYDPELFLPSGTRAGTFSITYTGRLISLAMRDPGLLFQAVRRLAAENVITPGTFRVRWYVDGKSKALIARAAEEYAGIAAFMEYHGYVPATEVPALLNGSSVLLVLANRSGADGPNGVMTTKFFEYLAVGKPILCVRGDGGCLEEVISRTRSGLSAHSADEAYGFIREHYLRWRDGKPCDDSPDWNEVRKFSRVEQARQFVEIFNFLS